MNHHGHEHHEHHDDMNHTLSSQTDGRYTCPMHPEVTSDKPGMCPKCHMALEKTKPNSHQHEHGHDKHAGHNPNMFKQKFWLSLLLTIPTLLFSHTVQSWLGFELMFPGSEYIPALLGQSSFFMAVLYS